MSVVLQFRTIRNSTVAINDQWLLLKPELLWLLIVLHISILITQQHQKLLLVRLPVVSHFSSGIVEGARRERAWKSTHARKGDTWGDFHARSRFDPSTIPEEGGLLVVYTFSDVIETIIRKPGFTTLCKPWIFYSL